MNTTRMTKATEIINERSTSLTEARMVVVRSRTIVVSIPEESKPSDMELTAYVIDGLDDIRARLAEDDHHDRGMPFRNPAERMFDTASVTLATSASRTAPPL